MDDHRKGKKANKKHGVSGFTSWRDAEPLSTDVSIDDDILGGLDDYLLGQEPDVEQEDDNEVDDEDDMRLYGYADADYDAQEDDRVGASLLETLSTGLSDLSSGLAATVVGPGPAPPTPSKKKTRKSMALPYHRLGGMPGTHPGASGPVPIGVPAVSAQALLIKTTTLAEAVAAIELRLQPSLPPLATKINGSADWRSWGVELGFAGLCLFLRQAGYAVAVQPSAVATLLSTPESGGGNGGVPPHSETAAASFRDTFDETFLLPRLTSNYMLHGRVGVL